MNIILCGMPGSGKSHFGKIAARNLNRSFIDTDLLVMAEYEILKHHRATCREITLKEGEPYFRDLENQVLKGLVSARGSIIALGGGTLCRPENIQILKEMGCIIYLKASPQALLERLMRKEVLPSYLDSANVEGSFERLLQQRLPLYEQNCEQMIDTESENVLEVITKVAKK